MISLTVAVLMDQWQKGAVKINLDDMPNCYIPTGASLSKTGNATKCMKATVMQ